MCGCPAGSLARRFWVISLLVSLFLLQAFSGLSMDNPLRTFTNLAGDSPHQDLSSSEVRFPYQTLSCHAGYRPHQDVTSSAGSSPHQTFHSFYADVEVDSGELLDGMLSGLVELILPLAEQTALQTIQELDNRPGNSTWRHPSHTDPATGRWVLGPQYTSRRWWTSGYFAGKLWLLYELTGDHFWREHARLYTDDLKPEMTYSGDHDTGLKIFTSFGNAFRLLQSQPDSRVVITGAQTLSTRFDSRIGAIKSWEPWEPWDWNYPVIIDNLMNLEILFWVSEFTGNERLGEIAEQHALTTLKHHIRDDGSHYHIVDFDAAGEPRWKGTVQGYGPESTWARGQAWGIYGFAMAYRFTGREEFADASRKMAGYFLEHLPNDGVPFYDFLDPAIPNTTKDASASAVAASGLIELYELTGEERWMEAAGMLLLALSEPEYLDDSGQMSSLLMRGTIHRGDAERGLIYADYYFLEALSRYSRLTGRPTPAITPQYQNYLGQNYPNPFRGTTQIPYAVEEPGNVRLSVYTVTGRKVYRVVDRQMAPGNYLATFEASSLDLAAGVYLYRLETQEEVLSQKMLLIR